MTPEALSALIDRHTAETDRYANMIRVLQARLARLKRCHTDQQLARFERDMLRLHILEDQCDARREQIFAELNGD